MTPGPAPAECFRYDGYEFDPILGRLTCRYSLGERRFAEQITFGSEGDWAQPALDAAARLVFLLVGVSYYKTAAPPVVDLGDLATTERERRFLRTYYLEGLGEFAYRNGIDLSGLTVVGPDLAHRAPTLFAPDNSRPLVPFGGGIDSIVTVESVRLGFPGTAIFIVSKEDDRFDAIERPAQMTGLPIIRAERALDPQVLASAELGFLNGHVPVTGIISAIAVMAAVLHNRGAVVMSNEWSASVGNLIVDGRAVNHQWSKGLEFELAFREILRDTFDPGVEYFSLLRPYTELWVARQFAELRRYHRAFRSCNRAFHIERTERFDRWCGECDKCCFINLILAPFLDPYDFFMVFDGREPLANPGLEGRFRALLGNWPEVKPFECVGDEEECRAAVLLAASRPDRAHNKIIQALAAELREAGAGSIGTDTLLAPMGDHCVPDVYATQG
jgi:hypothetical protein